MSPVWNGRSANVSALSAWARVVIVALIAISTGAFVWPAPVQAAARAGACGPVVADPLAEPVWPLIRLRPDLAWPLSTGAGVTVAVIDSGVSPNHPSLSGKILPGLDYIASKTSGFCDENGHGTLIAGLIAGRETVSAGFQFHGVAPDAAIVPVRVLRDQQRSFEDELPGRVANAIRWAVDTRGADVINLSLTTPPSPALAAAIGYAVGKGVVVVAAAGNEGDSSAKDPVTYPAAYDGVIGVAGVDKDDARLGISTAGAFIDVAAPGDRIAGPSPAGGGFLYTEEGGTSFAAAYVSGVAALIRAHDPSLSPAEVAARITQTADHPADVWNSGVGYGVVNPARAVGAITSGAGGPGGQARHLDLIVSGPDSSRRARIASAWIAAIGASLAVLILVAVPVTRRGVSRRWRPGRL